MKKRKVDIKIDNQPLALDRILKGGVYIIPKYQRNYRWTEDNWEELIQSVENGHENFFGTLFLMNIKNQTYPQDKLKIIIDQSTGSTATVTVPTAWNAKTATYISLDQVNKTSAASWTKYLSYHLIDKRQYLICFRKYIIHIQMM